MASSIRSKGVVRWDERRVDINEIHLASELGEQRQRCRYVGLGAACLHRLLLSDWLLSVLQVANETIRTPIMLFVSGEVVFTPQAFHWRTTRKASKITLSALSWTMADFSAFVMQRCYALFGDRASYEASGRGGIRTHGGFPHARFRVECLKPDSATLPSL